MYGADVADLRQLAAQFQQAAERLEANRMTVGNAIQVSAWIGPVAVRFRHEWDSDYSRRVQSAAHRLRDAAQSLRANADDQERTSAVGGGATRNSSDHAGMGSATLHLSETQEDDYESLLGLIKLMNSADGASESLEAIRKLLDSGAVDIGTFTEWAKKVKGLDAGAILSVAGLGITAHELGQAIGNEDPAATLEASLGLLFGAAGIAHPAVGAAWEVGYYLGESGYNSLQAVYDSPSSALDFAARQMYGGDATFDALEQYQRDALMTRYEGGAGLIASAVDSAGGALDDLWQWVSTGEGRGPR